MGAARRLLGEGRRRHEITASGMPCRKYTESILSAVHMHTYMWHDTRNQRFSSGYFLILLHIGHAEMEMDSSAS